MVKAGDLAKKYLGISEAPADSAAPADGSAVPSRLLSIEEREKIARLQGDLLWLVREGYVTEFIDGGLYASPPIAESRKKQAEAEEDDPENFPEAAPAVVETPQAAAPEVAPEAPATPEVPPTTP